MARDYYYTLRQKVSDDHKAIIDSIIEDEINYIIILMRLCEIYSYNYTSEFESLLDLRRKINE